MKKNNPVESFLTYRLYVNQFTYHLIAYQSLNSFVFKFDIALIIAIKF